MAPPPAGPPGFDTSRVSPQDAAVTLRSLRRRFAEAFDQAEDADDLLRRPAEGGLSPVEHAAWTASALDAIGTALRQVLVADNPRVALPPVDPTGPVPTAARDGDMGTPAAVLARLGETAGAVADAMAEMHGDAWSRTGQAGAGEVSALDIARLGVRIGVEHLRAVERAIQTGSE